MKKERHYISIVLFCMYILAVGIMCFIRPDEIPELGMNWMDVPVDKIVHFLMFIPFPSLAHSAMIPKEYGLVKQSLYIIAIAVLGTGTAYATEQIQDALGYRTYELNDLIADIAGIAAGSAVTLAHIALKTKKK